MPLTETMSVAKGAAPQLPNSLKLNLAEIVDDQKTCTANCFKVSSNGFKYLQHLDFHGS